MKAKINYISVSQTHAILSIETKIGPITQMVSGWARLDCTERELKSELEIPATSVAVDKRVDRETGETWEWLVFA